LFSSVPIPLHVLLFKPTSSAVIGPNCGFDKETSELSVASSDMADEDWSCRESGLDGGGGGGGDDDGDNSGDGTCSHPLFGNMLSGCASAI
jgi:hypothetical protein